MSKDTKSTFRFSDHPIGLSVALVIYVLSTGPIAHATNNGYLPEEVEIIYLPLAPLMFVKPIRQLFFYYTVHIWGGFPSGHTTLNAPFTE